MVRTRADGRVLKDRVRSPSYAIAYSRTYRRMFVRACVGTYGRMYVRSELTSVGNAPLRVLSRALRRQA